MRIIFAGGGTAGHINPALAVADYIRNHDENAEILYVGAVNSMEEKLASKANFDFKGITVSGFSREISLKGLKKNVVTVKRIFTSSRESKKIIKEFKPDICMGTGGYVSGPVLKVAAGMGIPIIIHEQNAYPGVANKMLAKYAKKVMLASNDARKYFNKDCDIVLTGNPVRTKVIQANKAASRAKLKLDSRPLVLSFGGSLGARKINEAVADLIKETSKDDRYQHIHAYGKYGTWFNDLLKQKGVDIKEHKNLDIREFIDDMDTCLAAADIVICRAGAITLSELQVQGKASILIPSPNVAENHQYHNAMALVRNNAAEIIEEKDLTGKGLTQKVDEILQNKGTLSQLENNAKKMAIIDTNEKIYNIIKKIVKETK